MELQLLKFKRKWSNGNRPYKQADEYLNEVIAAHKTKKRLEDGLYESLQIKKIKEVMEEWSTIQTLVDAMRDY